MSSLIAGEVIALYVMSCAMIGMPIALFYWKVYNLELFSDDLKSSWFVVLLFPLYSEGVVPAMPIEYLEQQPDIYIILTALIWPIRIGWNLVALGLKGAGRMIDAVDGEHGSQG